MADSTGMADLRAENVSRIVTGFALANYKFKQAVMISSSNSWKESYYQETKTELTGGLGSAVKGIPRLANFPYLEPTWTKKQSWLIKHGGEGVISYEDEKTNAIDVIARTLLRIARAITYSVDLEIYQALSENDTPTNINTLALTAGYEWDSATIANRDPIQDFLNARKELKIDNYGFGGEEILIYLSPKDYANVMGNSAVRSNAQIYTSEVGRNGVVGKIPGIGTLIESNNVTADKCLMCIKGICGTWKAAVPLTVVTIDDPGVKKTIRGWEIGVTQLTNPEAVCLITNTQA
jgi:hypothetical protein